MPKRGIRARFSQRDPCRTTREKSEVCRATRQGDSGHEDSREAERHAEKVSRPSALYASPYAGATSETISRPNTVTHTEASVRVNARYVSAGPRTIFSSPRSSE